MNQMMYYGGFALAVMLFIAAVLFFFLFRVPAVHRYFKSNSRKGLAAAEATTGKLKKKPEGPRRLTRAEYESRTEIIALPREDTAPIDSRRTAYLATGQLKKLPEGPRRLTRAEYESRTEVIALPRDDGGPADPHRTVYLATGPLHAQPAAPQSGPPGGSGDLDKTELL